MGFYHLKQRPSFCSFSAFYSFYESQGAVSWVWDGNYSGARFPGNGKRGALKDGHERGQHAAALLSHRREIAAKGTESRDPFSTTESARDLLLDG
jgi:hypothetical protein